MRIVTLEEHVSFPEMTALLPDRILENRKQSGAALQMQAKLADISGERLNSMKTSGISMQVLSVENTDVYLLPDSLAPDFASKYNDLLADRMKDHSESFTAFAL
jgi:hypothetical protein